MNLSSSLNLVSQSPIERQELRKLKKIINYLIQHVDSVQFREPVDWQGLQLLDYTKIVKKPMDLGTVASKIENLEYRFIEEVLDDLQLIWDNCKIYNQSGSWIYAIADKMEKYYRKLIKNYFTSIPITYPPRITESNQSSQPQRNVRVSTRRIEKHDSRIEDESSQVTDGKRWLLQRIKQLQPQHLGELVELIMTECPDAVSQRQDRLSIYVCQIEDYLWRDIRQKLTQLQDLQDKITKKVKL